MAIAVDPNYDKPQRIISTANLQQFAGVNHQLLIEKETNRPIIMDGETIGGKFKCASTEEVATKLDKTGGTVSGNLEVGGDVTVKGKTVERISSVSSSYIRYESGLQICWGIASANSSKTFAMPFVSKPFVGCIHTFLSPSADAVAAITIKAISNTSFTAISQNTGEQGVNTNFTEFMFCAIGMWK